MRGLRPARHSGPKLLRGASPSTPAPLPLSTGGEERTGFNFLIVKKRGADREAKALRDSARIVLKFSIRPPLR